MQNDNLPKRKHPRLKKYDYGQNGSYFITICVKNRECILGEIVRRGDCAPTTVCDDNDEQQTVGRNAHIPPIQRKMYKRRGEGTPLNTPIKSKNA